MFGAGAAFSRPVEPLAAPAPVIDWSGSGAGEDSTKKKRTVKGWLADFLGVSPKLADLAARTGLKVVIDPHKKS